MAESALVETYWADSPRAFAALMESIVSRHRDRIEAFELCRTSAGRPVPGFRMGSGARNVFLLGREHGHEPAGNCGLAALLDGLGQGRVPGSGAPFPEAARVLSALTLHVFPLMNPDGAERFSAAVPDSFPAGFWKYRKEDSDRYREIHGQPGHFFRAGRPPFFSEQRMAQWRATGRPVGSLYTDEGVELWLDFGNGRAPQTRALEEMMQRSHPSLFVDVHQMEGTTQLFVPRVVGAEVDAFRRLGNALLAGLESAGLPVNREYGIVEKWQDVTSIEWVHRAFGAPSFLFEIHNGYLWFDPERHKPEEVTLPVLSRTDILRSVWHGLSGMLLAAA